MTYDRTLSHCQVCGKGFCPEEGGPECDCMDDMRECEVCHEWNREREPCPCGAWVCEECGFTNGSWWLQCQSCGEGRMPQERQPANHSQSMPAQAGGR